MPPQFVVMCKVWGGVTGERIGELKDGDETKYFDTKEEAEDVAKELNEARNGDVFATASFQYWVERVS